MTRVYQQMQLIARVAAWSAAMRCLQVSETLNKVAILSLIMLPIEGRSHIQDHQPWGNRTPGVVDGSTLGVYHGCLLWLFTMSFSRKPWLFFFNGSNNKQHKGF